MLDKKKRDSTLTQPTDDRCEWAEQWHFFDSVQKYTPVFFSHFYSIGLIITLYSFVITNRQMHLWAFVQCEKSKPKSTRIKPSAFKNIKMCPVSTNTWKKGNVLFADFFFLEIICILCINSHSESINMYRWRPRQNCTQKPIFKMSHLFSLVCNNGPINFSFCSLCYKFSMVCWYIRKINESFLKKSFYAAHSGAQQYI